jgi:hypothetical protein
VHPTPTNINRARKHYGPLNQLSGREVKWLREMVPPIRDCTCLQDPGTAASQLAIGGQLTPMAYIMFTLSDNQKENIESFAHNNQISRAEAIRRALANFTGYDLSNDKVQRHQKYANAKEAAEARRQLQAERRRTNREIVKAAKQLGIEGKLKEMAQPK